jgi:trk system potassium uptake protein TrkA
MFVVIVGCSEVGFFLSRALAATGHEVAVIEREPHRHQLLTENMGMVAMLGDGADLDLLTNAGVRRADAVVALTGVDSTNLVICQLAKHLTKDATHKPRTVTIVKDPKNEPVFEAMGIDVVVNWVHLALGALEAGMPGQPLRHLMTLPQPGMELVCAAVPAGADIVGKRLGEVPLPPGSFFSLIVKRGQASLPTGPMVVEADDQLVAVISVGDEQLIYDILTGV